MSDKEELERLVAEIDKPLKERAKADPRSIKEIVESSLEREFSTAATAAVERRIDEKESRITALTREINERKRERADEKDELERLRRQLESHEERTHSRLEEARETLEDVPREPDNPAIKNWADDLGMTPAELLEEL